MTTQTELKLDTLSKLETAFLAWAATEKGLYVICETIYRARQLIRNGFVTYGIAGIYEAIRYDRSIAIGVDIDGYKLNNNHKAYLARHIMAKCPDLDGFFTCRGLAALK